MSVPTGFSVAAVSPHRFVAWKNVLNRPRQTVPRMRHPIGRWGSLVKNKQRRILPALKRSLVNLTLIPKCQYLLLQLRKRRTGGNRIKNTGLGGGRFDRFRVTRGHHGDQTSAKGKKQRL